MAKAKAKKKNVRLNDKQIGALNMFHSALEVVKSDIQLLKKDSEIIKLKRVCADLQVKLFIEQLVVNGHALTLLEQKLDDKLKSERTKLLQRIADELGIDKPFTGFDPVTGEIDN